MNNRATKVTPPTPTVATDAPGPRARRARAFATSAGLLLRIAPPQRDAIHTAAAACGLSATRYLLALVERDLADETGGTPASLRRAGANPAALRGTFQTARGPEQNAPTPAAEARRAIAVAAG